MDSFTEENKKRNTTILILLTLVALTVFGITWFYNRPNLFQNSNAWLFAKASIVWAIILFLMTSWSFTNTSYIRWGSFTVISILQLFSLLCMGHTDN